MCNPNDEQNETKRSERIKKSYTLQYTMNTIHVVSNEQTIESKQKSEKEKGRASVIARVQEERRFKCGFFNRTEKNQMIWLYFHPSQIRKKIQEQTKQNEKILNPLKITRKKERNKSRDTYSIDTREHLAHFPSVHGI